MKIYFHAETDLVRRVNDSPHLRSHSRYFSRLRKFLSAFSVEDPDAADFFFVPVNLIKFQFANITGDPLDDPAEYVESLPHLERGNHLLFAGGDYGQRKRSVHEAQHAGRAYPRPFGWLDERFILLAFESTGDLLPADLALLPYVLDPGRRTDALWRRWRRARPPVRDLLYSFVGTMAYEQLPPSHIRGGRLFEIATRTSDAFVGSSGEAQRIYGDHLGSDISMIQRSTFTLCPAGFGRWTYRLAQALFYGSIPVLLSDGYVKPWMREVPWDSISITVPEKELASVPEMLRGLSAERVAVYRAEIERAGGLASEATNHRFLERALAGAAQQRRPRATPSFPIHS